MATLNAILCASVSANTGIGQCWLDPKNIIGAILCPKNTSLPVATIAAALESAALSSSPLTRILPIYGLGNPQDSSEDIVVESFSTGQKEVVREGYQAWKFQIIGAGGLDLLIKLRKLNGAALDFYFVDANNVLYGTVDPANPGTYIKAIPQTGGYFWADPWKMNDGSKVSAYTIQFVFQPGWINESLGYVATGINMQSTVLGLQDVVLAQPAANSAAGSFNVTATITNGAVDMYAAYSTELASASLWTAINTATGASIPVASVTATPSFTAAPSYDGWIVALTTTAPPYPASGNVSISFASPATLSAAGVLNYVSNTLTVPKT